MRETGFYWVKREGEGFMEVAFYDSSVSRWSVVGAYSYHYNSDFVFISKDKLIAPGA